MKERGGLKSRERPGRMMRRGRRSNHRKRKEKRKRRRRYPVASQALIVPKVVHLNLCEDISNVKYLDRYNADKSDREVAEGTTEA